MEIAQECMLQCLNGGNCTECDLTGGKNYSCLHCWCLPGYYGDRCNDTFTTLLPDVSNDHSGNVARDTFTSPLATSGSGIHGADTSVVVLSVVAMVMILGAVVMFLLYRRRYSLRSCISGRGTTDNLTVEISNPVYDRLHNQGVSEDFSLDEDKPGTFSI